MKRLALIAGLLLPLCIGTVEGQFSFQPISTTLSTEGPNGSRTFRVQNRTESPLAVRFAVLTREVAPDGSETREPAEEGLFSLFPGRAVLEPGQTRNVRLSWRGPSTLERERAFRILAEQLPVDFDEDEAADGGGRLSIAFRYFGSIYVAPEGAEPRVEARAERSEDGLRLIVENTGSAHAILDSLQVTLTAGSGGERVEHTLSADELEGLAGSNLLAGLRRVQELPLPEEFPPGTITADIQFERQN